MEKLKFLYSVVIIITASFFLDACHSARKITANPPPAEETTTAVKTIYSPASESTPPISKPKRPVLKTTAATGEKNENEEAIIATYATKLNVAKQDIRNYKLYKFIDSWYGTPYKYAGRTRAGIDCSDFASQLLQDVYNITVSGTATNIYKQCKPIKPSELKEGDLVFFKIKSRAYSHIGVYLQNHKFVHASVHAGVIIDDLNEAYYKKYFRAAARVK